MAGHTDSGEKESSGGGAEKVAANSANANIYQTAQEPLLPFGCGRELDTCPRPCDSRHRTVAVHRCGVHAREDDICQARVESMRRVKGEWQGSKQTHAQAALTADSIPAARKTQTQMQRARWAKRTGLFAHNERKTVGQSSTHKLNKLPMRLDRAPPSSPLPPLPALITPLERIKPTRRPVKFVEGFELTRRRVVANPMRAGPILQNELKTDSNGKVRLLTLTRIQWSGISAFPNANICGSGLIHKPRQKKKTKLAAEDYEAGDLATALGQPVNLSTAVNGLTCPVPGRRKRILNGLTDGFRAVETGKMR
ncbi:hypothetical protein B0H16DRAFT_1458078 [Mycena metata]|uniref:Uncharacterized protein n=1 Tax=Mycena metata TaxID=1033252 RepID=A0AAD7J4A2_9AGAR|nr:hypothetical protein B0H16DRAFT_1458078 [Mycena metata]